MTKTLYTPVQGGTTRLALYAAALTVGSAASMVVEIAAGRLIAPYVGMSLYTWTAIIAVVLGGLSVGHWIGGRLAAPGVGRAGLARRTGLAFLGAALTTLGALPALHWAATVVMPLNLNPVAAIVAVTTFAFVAPSLASGIVSPLLTKMAIDERPHDAGRIIGRMYALGAAGAIAGTLLAGFLFIGWVGSRGTMFSTAAVYGILGVGFLMVRPAAKVVPAVASALVLAVGIGAWGAQTRAFETPCTVESSYYCIRIDDFQAMSGRPSTIMALDHMAHGINDRDNPRLIYSQYIQFVDEIAARRHPGPALDAYFVGGGALTLPRAWQASRPDLRAVVAEIDPDVTRLAQERMGYEPDPRVTIHDRDGRALLQSLPPEPQFDVVFGDAFHDFTMPAHLATREFHDAIAARLKPGGFYAMNVIESREKPEFLRALVKTLRLSFDAVEVWLEDEDARSGSRVTYVVVAGSTPLPTHRIDSAEGIERRWWRMPDAVLGSLEASPILTDDFAPVDRLMAHVTLDTVLSE
ncbi:MAG: fused MFS/spermidine synthase [Rhodospirillaceae bacterium]